MDENEASFTINQTSGCLVITPQGTLSTTQIELIRASTLEKLHLGSIKGVVVNLAGVPLIDSVEFEALRKTLLMIELMGAKPMLSGIHFAIASALAQMDSGLDQISVTRGVDDALTLLTKQQ